MHATHLLCNMPQLVIQKRLTTHPAPLPHHAASTPRASPRTAFGGNWEHPSRRTMRGVDPYHRCRLLPPVNPAEALPVQSRTTNSAASSSWPGILALGNRQLINTLSSEALASACRRISRGMLFIRPGMATPVTFTPRHGCPSLLPTESFGGPDEVSCPSLMNPVWRRGGCRRMTHHNEGCSPGAMAYRSTSSLSLPPCLPGHSSLTRVFDPKARDSSDHGLQSGASRSNRGS